MTLVAKALKLAIDFLLAVIKHSFPTTLTKVINALVSSGVFNKKLSISWTSDCWIRPQKMWRQYILYKRFVCASYRELRSADSSR